MILYPLTIDFDDLGLRREFFDIHVLSLQPTFTEFYGGVFLLLSAIYGNSIEDFSPPTIGF